MKPYLLALLLAAPLSAQSSYDMVRVSLDLHRTDTPVEPEPTQQVQEQPQLIDEIAKAVASKRDADDALAAPAVWAYRSRDGQIFSDAGGSFALERWACHLFPGRSCFAGIFAGKKTVGAGIGVALRKAVMAKGLQVVAFAAFVVPYDEGGKLSFAPALGFAVKF